MPDRQRRFARLRELADKHASPGGGRGDIEDILNQDPADPDDIECPRFVAISEFSNERTLFCDDSLDELIATLTELAFAEVRERPEAIVDLDTETRHEATNTVVITFTPQLPGREQECFVRFIGGERSALRLLCEVAEEHADGNVELAEAIAIADALLARAYPTGKRTGGETQ
jgi:hypothetical protein